MAKYFLHDDLEPWEQQPGEGPQAFQAFKVYLELGVQGGRRSTAKVRQTIGKNRRLIEKWSARLRWVDRCREYDRYIDRLARQQHDKEILAYRRRVAQQMRGKAQTLMLPDMALSAKLAANPNALDELNSLGVADLVAMSARTAFSLPNITKAEGQALGDVFDEQRAPADEPEDFLTTQIAEDDDLRSRAALLIQDASARRAELGPAPAGGVRVGGEQGPVDESAASDVPEPEAGVRTAWSRRRIVRSVPENSEAISSSR